MGVQRRVFPKRRVARSEGVQNPRRGKRSFQTVVPLRVPRADRGGGVLFVTPAGGFQGGRGARNRGEHHAKYVLYFPNPKRLFTALYGVQAESTTHSYTQS